MKRHANTEISQESLERKGTEGHVESCRGTIKFLTMQIRRFRGAIECSPRKLQSNFGHALGDGSIEKGIEWRVAEILDFRRCKLGDAEERSNAHAESIKVEKGDRTESYRVEKGDRTLTEGDCSANSNSR